MLTAQTILDQLGGTGKLIAMLGAHNFVAGERSVTFKIGRNSHKITHVQIELAADDTYSATFYATRGRYDIAPAHQVQGVYADGLREVVEAATGMHLTLAPRRSA